MKKFYSYVLVIFVLLLFSLSINAAVINVPDDFQSIQSAIDAAADGDTVLVAPGLYLENIDFDKEITLRSTQGRDHTIIDGNGDMVIRARAYFRLEGFTIRNGTGPPNAAGGLYSTVGGTVSNNLFEYNSANGGGGAITHAFSTEPLVITDNIIRNNRATSLGGGIYLQSDATIVSNQIYDNYAGNGGGIYSSAGRDTLVQRNAIFNNQAGNAGGGVAVRPTGGLFSENLVYGNSAQYGGGLAIIRDSITYPYFLNNVFYENDAEFGSEVYVDWPGGGGFPEANTLSPVFSNNQIIAKKAKTVFFCEKEYLIDFTLFTNNNVFSEGGTAYSAACGRMEAGKYNNLSVKPGFSDIENYNFHLINDSPSVDAGNNTVTNYPNYNYTLSVFDFDGSVRILDGNTDSNPIVDIGAFEFNPNGLIEFENNSLRVSENSGFASVNVCRQGGTDGVVTANLSTSDDSAIDGQDYTMTASSITFLDGEGGCKPVQIPLIDDNVIGADVKFSVVLISVTGGATLGFESAVEVEIEDNEEFISFDVSSNKSAYRLTDEVEIVITLSNSTTAANAKNIPNVRITNFLSGGVEISNIEASQGSCTGTYELNCNLGTLVTDDSAIITIRGIATTEGAFTYQANYNANPVNQREVFGGANIPININGIPTAQELFPLMPLTTWTYLVDGSEIETQTVLGNKKTIRGIPATGIIDSEGAVEFYTNDVNGLREHQVIDGVGDSITLIPPSTLINALPKIGDSIISSGTARVNVAGIGVLDVFYYRTARLFAPEDIEVAVGTFKAFRFIEEIRISGTTEEYYVDFRSGSTSWLVNGLGVVKQNSIVDGVISTKELQSISFAPQITSPQTGITLTSHSVAITWDAMDLPATGWALRAGNQGPGSQNLSSPPTLGPSATGGAITGLPTDGSTFTISLYAQLNGRWGLADSVTVSAYTAPSPEIVSPSNGATLASGSVTVNWDAMGTSATGWAVRAGNTGPGSQNLSAPPVLGPAATSDMLTGLPTDGSAFTITLYAQQGGKWKVVDSIPVNAFTAPSPEITSPSSGATIGGSSVTVTWDQMGTSATGWAVRAGNLGEGSQNLSAPPTLGSGATSDMLTGLPTDGSAFTITLYAQQGGKWKVVDSIPVNAFTAPSPEITSPSSGATIGGSSVTVTWDQMGTSATGWAVRAGNLGEGSQNLSAPPTLGSGATSDMLTGLPTDGSAFTITLYAQQGGKWKVVDSIPVIADTQ